jgi:hypothetical protein
VSQAAFPDQHGKHRILRKLCFAKQKTAELIAIFVRLTGIDPSVFQPSTEAFQKMPMAKFVIATALIPGMRAAS